MYSYDEFDRVFVENRAAQFRDQVDRRRRGELSEDEFKPLRLQNGLYLQLHAYMLRIAIPYGALSSDQLRGLAGIARDFDRGFGHFTTRQNSQFNWIRLVDAPDILDRLAGFDMHAIQTSGNCIRNVTCDPLAGAAHDEIGDRRVWAEIIRQWSTLHPEFAFLPRKFKIAISAGAEDRAATGFHDIGLRLVKGAGDETGFCILVGGGQGRTPRVGRTLAHFIPKRHILSYLEAVMRVYNAAGRRDNIYKALIKILADDMGIDAFAEAVNTAWGLVRDTTTDLPQVEYDRISAYFTPPDLPDTSPVPLALANARRHDAGFARWLRQNALPHYLPGYANAVVSLKSAGRPPGDASASEMEAIADLADDYGTGELRVTYQQNIIIPHVRRDALPAFYRDAREAAIGRLQVNISGCINGCGHHHAADIGILGVDKKGVEHYQVTVGGRAGEVAAIGRIIGPSFAEDDVPAVIETIIDTYLAGREADESFAAYITRSCTDALTGAVYQDRTPARCAL